MKKEAQSVEKIRRSGRVSAAIPIQLTGADTEGLQFMEDTTTVTLSRYGAAILSKRKLAPQQEFFIRRPDTNKEGEVRIVGVIEEHADVYIYAVGFVDPEINLWGIEFPPSTAPGETEHSILMACSGCQGREVVPLGELAFGIIEAEEGVLRYCKRCQTSTQWKPATGDAASPPPSPQVKQEPQAEPLPKPSERRRYLRAKVSTRACIRYLGSEDEVVCEDISRGGICFKSRRRYSKGMSVEVAAPYAPGTQSIFVPGRIAYVQELPEMSLFRYGLAYTTERKGLSRS